MEEWRDIEGYEGLYQVSSIGNVRSVDRFIWRPGQRKLAFLRGKPMKFFTSDSNHRVVSLRIGPFKQHLQVHRLVAAAFIDRPWSDVPLVVNHLDHDPTNNYVGNLEWCSQAENIRHAARAGRLNKKPRVTV
jgi:hypothetical protein